MQVGDAEGVGAGADDALGLARAGAEEEGAAGDLQAAARSGSLRIAPEPLLASRLAEQRLQAELPQHVVGVLLNSSQPAATTRTSDHEPHDDLAGAAREPGAEVPEEDDRGERRDAGGHQARARAGAHERGGADGHEEQVEQPASAARRVKKKAQSMNGQQRAMYVARSFWLWKTLVTA